VSVSMDKTGRVLDLPTGQCVDCVQFDTPATSVDLSPASDGWPPLMWGTWGSISGLTRPCKIIYLLAPVRKKAKPVKLSLPENLHVTSEDVIDEDDLKMETDVPEEVFASSEQISADLITPLPGSGWLNLLSLDIIKVKNKPKAAPKKPKAAPFFLLTIPGLETKFDLSNLSKDSEDSSRTLNLGFTNFTEFGSALGQASSDEHYLAMVASLMEKGPSGIDLEIRSLGPEGGGTIGALSQFLEMLKAGMRSNSSFEAVESYLGLFLKIHGDTIASEDELVNLLKRFRQFRMRSGPVYRGRLTLVSVFFSSVLFQISLQLDNPRVETSISAG
jgi:U3 small nucleolar RNA-associated protein 21